MNNPVVMKIKGAGCKTLVNKIFLSLSLTNPVSLHRIFFRNPLFGRTLHSLIKELKLPRMVNTTKINKKELLTLKANTC